jgi:hypothetical protein
MGINCARNDGASYTGWKYMKIMVSTVTMLGEAHRCPSVTYTWAEARKAAVRQYSLRG